VIHSGRHTLFQNVTPSANIQFGKQSEITVGYVQQAGQMGNDTHVVASHKLCGFQGSAGDALS
jgi:hypothetical protein